MKKIFTIGLMFAVFTPFVTFANLPCTWYSDGSNNGAAACYDSIGEPLSRQSSNGGTGLSGGASNVSDLFSFLGAGLNVATRLILGAAVVFFLWGVFKFVKSAGDEEARKEGKNQIVYGIIGIAVMVSMWGLVNFLTASVHLDTTVQSVPKLLDMPN